MNTAHAPKFVLENLLEVLEYERKRISLTLHDSVQNKLRLLLDETHDPGTRLKIQEILDELRNIAYNLVPKSLQEFSLKEYLLIYTATLNKTYKGQFHVDYRGNVQIEVPKDIETELFNIVQECMNNIIKYTDTPVVLIRYNQLPDVLELIVQDFGEGFDLESALQKNSIGLKSIYSRTDFVGGTCNIKTSPDGSGARVKITLPIQESWKEAEEPTIFDQDLAKQITAPDVPATPINPKKKNKTILLVDNQPEITEGLIAILKPNFPKCTFYNCTNTEDARKWLAKFPIDVVITDITMPDHSGLELVEFVKNRYPHVKRIIYSINDNPAYVYRATVKLTVDGYVWKEDAAGTAHEQHQLAKALTQILGGANTPYYSSQIEETRSYLGPKAYSEDDQTHRDIFRQYAKLLREIGKKDLLKGNEKWRKLLSQKTRERLNMIADADSIDRYFRQYKQKLHIDDDWEMIQFLLKIANDFGFYSDEQNTKA
ncbi:MAG TPA: response regulator [Chitinophagales bacterium]|nr:response regulator [Chitinophagales bacterium]